MEALESARLLLQIEPGLADGQGRRAQVLVGNKCDMDEGKRAVPYSKGQALADEFGIQFFETSAKSNVNVDEVRLRRPRPSVLITLGWRAQRVPGVRSPCAARSVRLS